MQLTAKMDNTSNITNANQDHNRMVISVLMASLMANELDSMQQHEILQNNKALIRDVASPLAPILQTPYLHAGFMIDHMRTKGGAAYTFFFQPEELNIQNMLTIAIKGASALVDGLTLNQYSRSDLAAYFQSLKELVEKINAEFENNNMYMAVAAALHGFISDAQNA